MIKSSLPVPEMMVTASPELCLSGDHGHAHCPGCVDLLPVGYSTNLEKRRSSNSDPGLTPHLYHVVDQADVDEVALPGQLRARLAAVALTRAPLRLPAGKVVIHDPAPAASLIRFSYRHMVLIPTPTRAAAFSLLSPNS